jgi:hypothetical protein
MSRSRALPLAAVVALFAFSAAGRGRPAAAAATGTLTYKPTKDDERPMVVKATIHPQGNDFALQLEFNKPPMGPECKNRCANAQLLLDTDDDVTTGMQQGRGKPPTGADLSIAVIGGQDYSDTGKTQNFVQAKVRQLTTDARIPEDGELISSLDTRFERERLEVDGKEVRISIDATSGMLPQGKTCRLLYLPPSSKAIVVKCKGMGGDVPAGDVNATVMKGRSRGVQMKPRETQPDSTPVSKPPKVPVRQIDPRWGAGG